MSLSDQLAAKLQMLAGDSSAVPATASLSTADGIVLDIDLTAVDSMSAASREIRLQVPSLVGAGFDVLKEWAEDLSQRVTYLLENIGPLELDPSNNQVLIRSTPPSAQSGTREFYEVLLQSHADGNFSLQRFRSDTGKPGRTQIDMQTTHEVLGRLVDDLVDTIPQSA